MKKCIIITSYIEGNLSDLVDIGQSDLVICADGGYNHAKAAGIKPDLLIGDFDSLQGKIQSGIEIINFPKEKDDTDTGLCIQAGMEMGYKDILIAGGIGGRVDHTIANIQLMSSFAPKVDSISMIDERNFCTVMTGGKMKISKKESQHMSLLSLSDECKGVTITGVQYPLCKHTLTNKFPLGVSNEFKDAEAVISLDFGTLLVILSKD